MDSLWREFTQAYLGRLDAISFHMRHRMAGGFAGARKSKAKGSSIEYSDFRNYTFGDDIRRIDWNSYGRLDKLFVKVFEEEKQACLSIFLDKSASMDFGEPNKFRYAKIFAASLAYIALSATDKVDLYTFDRSLSLDKGNISAKGQFAGLIEFLDGLSPGGVTAMDSAFDSFNSYRVATGVGILLSDFLTDTDYETVIKKMQYKNKQVCVVHILSPQEISPGYEGALRLTDLETNDVLDLEMDDLLLGSYQKELKRFTKGIEAFCKKRGVGYVPATTDTAILGWISAVAAH